MKSFPGIMALCALGLLSGCVSILPDPSPAPSVYRLMTGVEAVPSAENAEVIRIDRPGVSEIFNARDIVATMNSQKISVIAQAQWAEATPVLVQTALIDSLSNHPHFIGLLPSSGARTETRLHLTVRHFEADFDRGPESAPLAIVEYGVTYARASDRKLLGTYTVRQTQRADTINVSSIVEAIRSANGAAMTDIVSWLDAQRALNPA